MVPKFGNPPGEPRSLSAAVLLQLEHAMRAFASDAPESADLLRNVLGQIAADGRERGLRPEDLVIALRHAQERVPELATRSDADRSRLRTEMIRAMLEAYYRG